MQSARKSIILDKKETDFGETMAQKQLLELVGSVEQIIFKNESHGYTILELNTGDELVVVVGTMPYVSCGEELQIIGTWVNHPTFGDQFKAETFERSKPATSGAILKYLSSGAIKGVGAATAAKIVEMFGEQTLDIIEQEPERLCAIKGITASKAEKIHDEFQRVFGIKELMLYLKQYHITPEESIRIWKAFGNRAKEEMEHDPYCLCQESIGIDFVRADAIAEQFNTPQDDSFRLQSGILYILSHNINNGHTCLPTDKLIKVACSLLDVSHELLVTTLQQMKERKMVSYDMFGEREYIFTNRMYDAETYCAQRLMMLLQYPAQSIVGAEGYIQDLEEKYNIQYADKQKKAICQALEKGILILTGGPGTGKTTTLNAIIQILEFEGEKVLLGAPTGRAAKRMTELTGCEAKTIHRLLQVEWNEQERPTFSKNERNLLECDALILDELSMVDVTLFEGVLRALPLGCRLILVGDGDQLPSVGAGNVLGNLIDTNLLPVVQLNEIFRQSMESLIVTNAHKIVNGQMPDLRTKDNDFFFLPCNDSQRISQTIVGLCSERLPNTYGYSPFNDIQVLCPSRKGELGTASFNKKLQEKLNPPHEEKREVVINQIILREGDKVMQSKNNYNLPWSKEDGTCGEGVYNGDVGILLEIDKREGTLIVQVDDKFVLYTMESASELEHAYAITVHKSQGNEFPAVIMPMFPGPPQLYYRNLLYTGITRAKNMVILVGMERTVHTMVENDRKTRRYSGLYYFMIGETDHEKAEFEK